MSTNNLNQENIIKKVYDPPTQSLRTAIVATLPPGVIDVQINDTTDSIKIGNGSGNYLKINPDGSINTAFEPSGTVLSNVFNEVTSVPSGVSTVIASYPAIAGTKLMKIDFGGTNVAIYSVSIAGNIQAKKYTYFTELNECADFKDGLIVNDGDLIQISVIHNRPDLGDFSANILIQN